MYLRLSPAQRLVSKLPIPWGYVRSKLAALWQCRPWEVEDAPALEVSLALRLAAIEAEEAAEK